MDPRAAGAERETSAGRGRAELAARLLALGGLALAAVAPLSWNDWLPGGYRLRSLFGSETARALRATEQHALDRLASFESENRSFPAGGIVFFGSSSIERFPLTECFPGKPCLNRGIENASAELLERVLERCLPDARPAGVVLYLGGVDVRDPRADTEATLRHTAAILSRVAFSWPDVPVLVLGLLPARHMDQGARERLEWTNDRLLRLAFTHRATFVFTARPPLMDSSGNLSEELSRDKLHLSGPGYAVLARWIVEDGGAIGGLLAP